MDVGGSRCTALAGNHPSDVWVLSSGTSCTRAGRLHQQHLEANWGHQVIQQQQRDKKIKQLNEGNGKYFLLPTQMDAILLVLLPLRLTPRPEGCQGLTTTPAQLEQREGCPGRARCWDTGDVVGDQGTGRQGMFWEGDQSTGIRGCTGRPMSPVRVRFTVTQAVPRCWCGASHCSVVPKPGLVSFSGQKCFTSGSPTSGVDQTSTNPFYRQYPPFPCRWTAVWHQEPRAEAGAGAGSGAGAQPASGAARPCGAAHPEPRPGMERDPAPHRGLIPLLGHPRAKKYNTCRIRVQTG